MKVCHFVASTGLGRGDAFVYLVNALANDIEVVLVAPRNARFREMVDKRIKIYEYKSINTRMNPLLLFELYKLFKRINPDIVHTHFAKASEIFYLMNRFLGFHHVATKHNPRKGRIYNKIDHVIAVSNGVAESIMHDNVKVIHNGLPEIELAHKEPRDDVYTILAVGRLEKIKAFDKLINECSKLSFDFLLLIVGEGRERAHLEKLTKDLKLENNVRLLGFRYDVPSLMQQANVVVVCSHSEGFSLVIIEAMFYSNMIVSRNVGIAAEIFPDILLIEDFNISEKLQEVHDHGDKFARCFAEMKSRYRTMFSIENIAKEHVGYYKKLSG